jgi:5-formyltetrahydrofolate cyclo-ligase
MNKQELRKTYQAKRAQLSKEQVEEGSQKICDLLFKKFKFKEISSIHIFLPIETKNEVNTNLIISRLRDKFPSVKVVVPKIAELNIESFVLTSETKLFKNSLGVPEPLNGVPFSHPQLDFVLLPLLVFDKSGNRIGYGKGF